MEFGIVRLDKESKVALMAALMYDADGGDSETPPMEEAVLTAIEIEQLVHVKLQEQKKLPRE